ncbi:MAG TPA: hypothetical protein VKT29_10345, partial [Terriglobales bacterium]|nr:hypothetical protein [Terriglobales bacterium]
KAARFSSRQAAADKPAAMTIRGALAGCGGFTLWLLNWAWDITDPKSCFSEVQFFPGAFFLLLPSTKLHAPEKPKTGSSPAAA